MHSHVDTQFLLHVLQKKSSKTYAPHQEAFILYLAQFDRIYENALEDDVVQFLLQWSCDFVDGGFVVNPQTKAAFASGRSAVRALFTHNKVPLPYDPEYLRIVHRAIKMQCTQYAVQQAPPLGCFDLRKMLVACMQSKVCIFSVQEALSP
jgi:hypothetical protein